MKRTVVAIIVACWFSPAVLAQFDQPAEKSLTIETDPLHYCKVEIIDEISVPAKGEGILDELNVKEGQLVEKGQVLGVIETTDVELAVAIATHEYAAAKKTAENTLSIQAAVKAYEVAVAEYDSSVEANEETEGTVTKTELRRKKLQADRAMMQAELAKHELMVANFDAQAKFKGLQRAKVALTRRQIISRINGVVVKLNKHEGDWVQPGETVMRVVQMDRLRIEGDVDGTKHAHHEVIGRPVKIKVYLTGGGEENLEGKIVYASSIIESNEYTVRAEVLNRKVNDQWLLTPGLNARMELLDGGFPQFGGILAR